MEDTKDGEPRHPLGVYAGPQPDPAGGEWRVPLSMSGIGKDDRFARVEAELKALSEMIRSLSPAPGTLGHPLQPQNHPALRGPRANVRPVGAGQGQGQSRPPASGIWEALRAHEERFNSFQQYVDTRLDQIENRITNLDLTVFGGTD